MQYAIAIHGGAGSILKSSMTPEYEIAYTNSLRRAITIAENLLCGGASSLDAVEVAVRDLENNPLFNAGRGSVFHLSGKEQ